MAVPVAELLRLAQYNAGVYNAGSNPYGMDGYGYATNLPLLASDAAAVANYLATDLAPLAEMADQVSQLNAIRDEIATVAGQGTNVSTLAGLRTQITSLAQISNQITAAAGNSANINAVGANSANINTVAGAASNINAVAGALNNVATLIANLTNINTLAARAADMALLADIQDGTIATSAITRVAAAVVPITNVSTNIADVQLIADNLSAVQSVAGIAANVSTVAGAIPAVGTVAGSIGAVSLAAANIASIQAAPQAATDAANQAAALSGTSTTSLAIGTGAKTFATQASKKFAVGSWILVTSAAAPTVNWMHGQVTAYSGTSLTLNVIATGGSGTRTDWQLAISGPQGAPAAGTGDFIGAASSTAGNLVSFGNGTGKQGADSGIPATLVSSALQPGASADQLVDGANSKLLTTAERNKLAGIAAGADVTSGTTVGAAVNSATSKTTPVDADGLALSDSAASGALKKLTWANLKATLKTFFDPIYAAAVHNHAWGDINGKPDAVSSIGSLTPAANKLAYYTGATTAALADISAAGRALIDDADAPAQRLTLGLGSMATRNVTISTADPSGGADGDIWLKV
ncbi:MAG: hypothetical protein K0R85_250 [Devosia sp.]|jgi:hypothetical protein|nr:hypothetical protein [Devosia sp.]